MATRRLSDRNDTYSTRGGDEFVYTLKGDDKITISGLFYDPENDQTRITVYAGPGDDQVLSVISTSGQVAYGGPGNDRIEIQGGDANWGAAYGGGGRDTLICIGSGEGCFLDGGAGPDKLINRNESIARMDGGRGKDAFTAGPGSADRFLFSKGDTVAGSQRDTIRGFEQGDDRIDLGAIDANTQEANDQAFTFVASTKNPAIGELSYYRSGDNTVVVGNDGTTTFEIMLVGFDQELVAADFGL